MPLNYPVDTGRKLNVHNTFRRRPGRLLNVLCTFNFRPVSAGYETYGCHDHNNKENKPGILSFIFPELGPFFM